MRQLLFAAREASIAALILIPVFLFLKRSRFHCRTQYLLYALFAFYLAGVYAVAGLPNVLFLRFQPRVNWEPFLYLLSDRKGSSLNVLLFLPLGFFLSILWKDFRNPLRTVLLGFALSGAIEFLQIFTFRTTDVNDLITNTTGTLTGWVLGWLAGKLFPVLRQENRKGDLPLILGTVFGIMFFVHPFFSRILRRFL